MMNRGPLLGWCVLGIVGMLVGLPSSFAVSSGEELDCGQYGVVRVLNKWKNQCTGVFLSPNVLVAAGHCFRDTPWVAVQNLRGEWVRSVMHRADVKSLDASGSVLEQTLYHDFGIALFPKDTASDLGITKFLKPASQRQGPDSMVTMMGYGWTGPLNSQKQTGACYSGANKISAWGYEFSGQKPDAEQIAYVLEGEHDRYPGFKVSATLPGDSGGPLLDSRGALIGLASAATYSTEGARHITSFFLSLHNRAVKNIVKSFLEEPLVKGVEPPQEFRAWD